MELNYRRGIPNQTGTYACRIPHAFMNGIWEDQFFLWYEGKWCYPCSDQTYRGDPDEVWWIGPLPRKMASTEISQCPAYIYARKRVGDEGYLEGPTPLLSSLLRSPPGPREAIFRVDLEEPKKVYTSFNGKWIKVK